MSGSKDLDHLLAQASPTLDPENYVFLCVPATYGNHVEWQPIASFVEQEGLTLVVRQTVADAYGLTYDAVFKRITLEVYSSLEAVGLTAGFSKRLAENDISANVFAAFHHDHIFVPAKDADRAMAALARLKD